MRRNKRKRMMVGILALALLLTGCLCSASGQKAYAGNYFNAISYYDSHYNQVAFYPTSDTNGSIYYATRAKLAASNTAYRTIGWKMTVMNLNGSNLQTLYFKLGGSYMYLVNTERIGSYEYNLYEMSLYHMKSRMNSKARKAVNEGKADIKLDACIAIVKNGKVKGAMSDNGPTSGKVYTTYNGITGAANWTYATKQSLYSYFNKFIVGLFYDIQVIPDDGIESVSGSGYYCYGTYITVSAKVATGYDFDSWNGVERGGTKKMSFYVTESGMCIATAVPKILRIYYHRNLTPQDEMVDYNIKPYRKGGADLDKFSWKKNGKEPLGWAESPSATNIKYKNGAHVSGNWLIKKVPTIHLYAVWEQELPTPDPDKDKDDPQGNSPNPPAPQPTDPWPTIPDPIQPVEPEPNLPDPPEEEKPTPNKVVRCRFISSKYFEDECGNLIPQENGGLAAESIWATDVLKRQILRYALHKS